MCSRKRVNKNFAQITPSIHSMKLRSRLIICSNEDFNRFGLEAKLPTSSHSMTLRPRNHKLKVATTIKAKTKVQKVVKKLQRRKIDISVQNDQTSSHIGTRQTISDRNNTFDDLNDDCVRLIFEKFALQELMLLRGISVRCTSIIEQIFHGMRSLKLFVGHYSVREYSQNVKYLMLKDDDFRLKLSDHYENDDLVINYRMVTNLSYQTYYANPTTFLPRLFSNVSKLFILLSKDYSAFFPDPNLNNRKQIAHFHSHFFDFSLMLKEFPNLSTLFIMNPSTFKTNRLWNNIASKASLRSLYLISVRDVFLIPTNIYRNLQQLTIVTNCKSGMDFVLPYLGSNCTKLAFYWRSWECEQLQAGLNLNPNLMNNITHFSIGPSFHIFRPDSLLLSKCAQLKSLTFLQISLCSQEITLKDICAQLASLSQLIELKLFDLNNHLKTDERDVPSFRSLPSIANLLLDISFANSDALNQIVNFDTLQYVFPKAFPSLRKVEVLCLNQIVLNQSRDCFSNKLRFLHLRQSLFYTNLDAMFEPSKYLGRHAYNDNRDLIDLDINSELGVQF